ncbi:MAG: DUF262 domain-containing protein [Acidobacteriota bacterium]|nr:DUF262 domain-containing protein [Acidobacteriota bacterium]
MDEFSLGKYPQSSLLVVYSERGEIKLNPEYQRISGIWTREKRQLLIDSLLNGFDVPKLYFHEFVPYNQEDGKRYRYAIVDGRQRLETIWEFIDGNLPLAEDFRYLRDDSVKAGGLDYPTLAKRYPHIKARFDATPIDIVTIRTNDIELIEDMFSRLNEAVPLNAPEKRGALGGPMPAAIRRVSAHTFFSKHVPFPDSRYRHRDLAAKFLYIEFSNAIPNTKKAYLDGFVKDFRRWRKEGDKRASASAVSALVGSVEETLVLMNSVFGISDSLLRQVGMITVYFHLFRQVRLKRVGHVRREMLSKFERDREKNRELVEAMGESSKQVDAQFLEFDKHSQTPNDAYAIRIRLGILLRYLGKHFGVKYDAAILQPAE